MYLFKIKILFNYQLNDTLNQKQLSILQLFLILTLIKEITSSEIPIRLNCSERNRFLSPLFKQGWTIVEDRDALYKQYKFENFVQVNSMFSKIHLSICSFSFNLTII